MKYILLTLILAGFSCGEDRTKIISGLEGAQPPNFDILLMDGKTQISSQKISVGQPFVIFYLSPHCPYCKAQTQELTEEIKNINNIRFYLLSSSPLDEMKMFSNNYKLSNFSNITVGQVRDSSFLKYYNISAVPFLAIYNKQKKLNEVVVGNISTSKIKAIAFQ